LKFISGDLTGLTDSLLTLGTGSHVKPNVRAQGQGLKALAEAIDIGPAIGLETNVMEQIINVMDSETAKTPFGTLVDFEGAKFQPFKGIQHGQLGKYSHHRFLGVLTANNSTHQVGDRGQIRTSRCMSVTWPKASYSTKYPGFPNSSLPCGPAVSYSAT